ncbi:MAG: NAD(P)H-hydrate epimerase [Clostridia bacterium]|nr:NAD(P)H-hydrate epimerase [Clostridia bacterium]MEE1023907.1 NAD(P)H-hydrate epimerase [Acutalibacteraceae bacterium]
MTEVISVENMRKSDEYTIKNFCDSKTLMLKAGTAVYNSCKWQGNILIACGSGNNAGDGYVLALLLKEQGLTPHILLLKDKFSPDGEYYFSKCQNAGIPYSFYKGEKISADIIADCIFGTGFCGEVNGTAADMINAVNSSGAYVISVDINSGMNGNTGIGMPCVRSDLTISIGSFKPGHFIGDAKSNIKNLVNCDIGIKPLDRPYELHEAFNGAFLELTEDELSPYGYSEHPCRAVLNCSKHIGKTIGIKNGIQIISDGSRVILVK